MAGQKVPSLRTSIVTSTDTDDDDNEHDCIDNIGRDAAGHYVCTECGEHVNVADAECVWCGTYPCRCDDAYEAYRDRLLGV